MCNTQRSGNLDCGFGEPDLRIERIIAQSGGDSEAELPEVLRGRLSKGDRILIQFDQVILSNVISFFT